MCDALGTILVNHLSKNDLASVDRVSPGSRVLYSYISFYIKTVFLQQLSAEPHELLELGTNGHEMKEWRQSSLGAYNRKRWVDMARLWACFHILPSNDSDSDDYDDDDVEF